MKEFEKEIIDQTYEEVKEGNEIILEKRDINNQYSEHDLYCLFYNYMKEQLGFPKAFSEEDKVKIVNDWCNNNKNKNSYNFEEDKSLLEYHFS